MSLNVFHGTQNHIECNNVVNRIIECFFDDIHNENVCGGAISLSKLDSYFYCYYSSFNKCSAKSSGGIHITKSYCTDCSFICAVECWNFEDFAYFSFFSSSGSSSCSYFSTHFCHGRNSCTRLWSTSVYVSHINTTNNEGYQEPSLVIGGFKYSSLCYAESCSSTADRIGFNICSGDYATISHVHYQNCTITLHADDYFNHVQIHLVNNCYLEYIYIISQYVEHVNALSAILSTVLCEYIYLIGSQKVSNIQLNNEFVFLNETTITMIYSFLNTGLCQYDVIESITFKCSHNLHSYYILYYLFLIYVD